MRTTRRIGRIFAASAGRERGGTRGLAAIVTLALAITSLTVWHSGTAVATGAEGAVPALRQLPDRVEFQADPRVPVLDSEVQVGHRLAAGQLQRVDLSGQLPASHDVALVRIVGFAATVDTTVSATGTPALHVRAGQSASTSVLVPVVEDSISLLATADLDVRVEILASFVGDPHAPGATIALGVPVTRADTASGLAGDAVTTDPIRVGLVGEGEVPSGGVRAVYATATIEVAAATTLELGGQALSVPSGTTSITTILMPDEQGGVEVSLTNGSGSLRLDVRGWIVEPEQNSNRANVSGSTAPVLFPAISVDVDSRGPVPLPVSARADTSHLLAIVSGTASDQPTVVEFDDLRGAARGAMVDPTAGMQAQLALIPVPEAGAVVSARRGSSRITVTPVGEVLSTYVRVENGDLDVTVTGYQDREHVDLGEVGVIRLTGTLSSASLAVESVSVLANGLMIGTASLGHGLDGLQWRFETAVPGSGVYDFEIVVRDRSGRQASERISLQVTLPSSTEIVVAADVVVVTEDAGWPEVWAVTDESVVYGADPGFEPGQVIVGDATAGAPRGYLRIVQSINYVEAVGWIVQTSRAALTDVFLQADVQEEIDLLAHAAPQLEFVDGFIEGDTTDIEIVDEGFPSVYLVEGDSIDVEPYFNPIETVTSGAVGLTAEPVLSTALLSNRIQALTGEADLGVGPEILFKRSLRFESSLAIRNGQVTDNSKAAPGTRQAARTEVKASGGLSLSGTVETTYTLDFKLKIVMQWGWLSTPYVEVFHLIDTTESKTAVTLEAFYGAAAQNQNPLSSPKNVKKELARVKFPAVRFLIGVVPVWLSAEASVGMQATLKAEVSISTELGFQTSHKVGTRYTVDSGWDDWINKYETTYRTPLWGSTGKESLTAQGDLEGTYGPTIKLEISLYDSTGAVLSAGASGGIKVTVSGDEKGNTVDLELFAQILAAIEVEIKAPFIDHTLLDAKLAEITATANLLTQSWEFGSEGIPTYEGGSGPHDALAVITSSLPEALLGSRYEYQLTARGGSPPYSWSLQEGALPEGVLLTRSGLLSGTPTIAGSSQLVFSVVDDAGAREIFSGNLDVSAVDPDVVYTGYVGIPFHVNMAEYSYYLQSVRNVDISGNLPNGMYIAEMAIGGIPEELGDFDLTLAYTLNGAREIRRLRLSITASPPDSMNGALGRLAVAEAGASASVSFKQSPSGRYSAATLGDALYVWDSVDDTLRRLTAGYAAARAVAWSPDSRYLVFSTEENGLRYCGRPVSLPHIWDALTGSVARVPIPTPDNGTLLRLLSPNSWSPDSTMLSLSVSFARNCSFQDPARIAVWTVASTTTRLLPQCTTTSGFPAACGQVRARISSEGPYVWPTDGFLRYHSGPYLYRWDGTEPQPEPMQIEGAYDLVHSAISPTGRHLLAAFEDEGARGVQIVDLETGSITRFHGSSFSYHEFSEDGKYLNITAPVGQTRLIIDVESGDIVYELPGAAQLGWSGSHFIYMDGLSGRGRLAALDVTDGSVSLWEGRLDEWTGDGPWVSSHLVEIGSAGNVFISRRSTGSLARSYHEERVGGR